MQLTLEQLFGEGSSQTSGNLTIQKSALRGLTCSQNNRAEQLMAAILFNANEQFVGIVSDDLGNILTSENGTLVSYDNSNLYDYLIIEQWRTVLNKPKVIHTFLFHQLNVL